MAQNAIVDTFENKVEGTYKMGTIVDDMNRALFDALRTLDRKKLDNFSRVCSRSRSRNRVYEPFEKGGIHRTIEELIVLY